MTTPIQQKIRDELNEKEGGKQRMLQEVILFSFASEDNLKNDKEG